jgi:8-oxo-dGTP diphosphatase
VLVVRGGKVLLGRRLAPHGYGTWSLPGGRPRQGESTPECALRELREETGLEARQPQVVYETVNGFPESRLVFRTRFVHVEDAGGQPQVREPDKTADWRWHRWSELPTPLFAPVTSLVKSGYDPLASALGDASS